jgi:hypothetical protein
MGLRVATPLPPPRAFFLLVLHRLRDLGSVAELGAPATAACSETCAPSTFLHTIMAAMARIAAATGTCPGAGILPGCISHISELGAELIVCWPCSARNDAVSLTRMQLVSSGRLTRPRLHATDPTLHAELLHRRMLALVEFEGGLIWSCSRLGRSSRLAATGTTRCRQFEGNSGCLGRVLLPTKLLVHGSMHASPRGTRRSNGLLTSTQSALPRNFGPRGRRRAWTQQTALPPCGRGWLPVPPPPARSRSPLAATITLPMPPQGLRRMLDSGDPLLATGAS